jgi:NitT/TauT family transport system substrate-binding protein
MVMRPSLVSLVEKARQGQKDAWAALVVRMYPWALRLARRRLPPGLPAEDAVQEALLTAFQKLAALRQPEAFPSWLAAILGSQCLRLALRQPPEVSLDRMEDLGLLPRPAGQNPAEALETMEIMDAFDRAVEGLPGHLRDVCRLHYRRGLPLPEVAAACGLPQGTVKKRLFLARPLLQRELARFRGQGLFRMGYMPVSDHLLAMCAERMSQGRSLPLHSRRYLSWAALAEDLRLGRLDAAFIMAPLALSLRQAGTPLLYVLDGHHDGSAVSLSRNAPRRECLGLPGERSTHGVLLHQLLRDRPELPRLPTQVVNPSSVLGSLRRNEIGSFFCAEPWSTRCAQEGLGETLVRSRDILPGHPCCILAVRREFAAARGQVVADYVATLLKARDRVLRDPDFAARAQAACTGIDPGVARRVLDEKAVSFDDLAPDEGRLSAFARLAREAGVIDPACSALGFACRDYLVSNAA